MDPTLERRLDEAIRAFHDRWEALSSGPAATRPSVEQRLAQALEHARRAGDLDEGEWPAGRASILLWAKARKAWVTAQTLAYAFTLPPALALLFSGMKVAALAVALAGIGTGALAALLGRPARVRQRAIARALGRAAAPGA